MKIFERLNRPGGDSMYRCKIVSIIFSMIILSGCAGMRTKELNTVQKTNQLSPGMSYEEVVQLLGQPKSSQFVDDKWVLKYTLHEPQRGWVPYYLLFDKKKKRLASWYLDEEEYQRTQQMRMQTKRAIRPTIRPRTGGSALRGAPIYGPAGYIPPAV
jgi:outer membrane protein assembly factor BamE (lipoprotein component of BamABCDE complex)